jgi:hypothetical protein
MIEGVQVDVLAEEVEEDVGFGLVGRRGLQKLSSMTSTSSTRMWPGGGGGSVGSNCVRRRDDGGGSPVAAN